jgi:hypothetical protein
MDNFIIIICVVIALGIGYFIGVHLTIDNFVKGYFTVDDFAEEYDQPTQEWISPTTGKLLDSEHKISVYIEIVDGVLYTYDSKTNKYMAHGATRIEMEDMLVSKYPNTLFGMTEENLREVGFIE